MKLKISLITLILATFLCHAQDRNIKHPKLKPLKAQTFNPNGIKLFPNPSTDQISLEFKTQVSNLKIEIIDVRGRLMFKNEVENTSLEKVNVNAFPQGVYFIRVHSDSVEDFLRFVKK